MKPFILTFIFCTFLLETSKGCHSIYDGGNPSFQRPSTSNREDPSQRIIRLLSNHGLPNTVINCVVNANMRGLARSKRQLTSFQPDKFVTPHDGFPISHPTVTPHDRIPISHPPVTPKENKLLKECGNFPNVCLEIVKCANRLNVNLPSILFPPTPAPTRPPTPAPTRSVLRRRRPVQNLRAILGPKTIPVKLRQLAKHNFT